jgi:hypothetical protein
MARIDDYNNAAGLSRAVLADVDPEPLAEFSGAELIRAGDEARLHFPFLGKPVQVTWPGVSISLVDSEDEIPIQQQVLVLHYLERAWHSGGPALTGEWMAFQDVPDGKFYLDAYQRRAKIPFIQGFGSRPDLLVPLAEAAHAAEALDLGDASVSVPALPRIRAALVLWEGDDEFPPDGNILFDKNTPSYLSAEDIAWLSGMIVYPLVGMAASAAGKA